ncbi:MAG: histidine phosphatase family protein [Christensenellaceae bacterium]|nr:histidine phosphatase family protein [Christensenellaceae bacterium]
MTELVLVRHGATEMNLSGRYCGRLDPPLSESGRAAVRETARHLAGFRPERVYCSPALRAKETAAIIAPDMPVIEMPELREMDFGAFEGLAADEIERRMPEAWQAYMADWLHFKFPQGDSVQEYLAGAANTIRAIVEKSGDGGMLGVSHKGFVMAALSTLLHGDSIHLFCYDIRPAGVARRTVAGGFPVLTQLI